MLPGIANLRALAVAAVLPPLLVWSAGAAQAATLGQMTVLSTLGSRFEAVVEIMGATGDGRRMLAECFRLAPTGEGDLPTLRNARLTVEESAGRPQLRISSEQTISDPLLQVSVRIGCGAETGRNYVLLIDPPNRRAQPPTLVRPLARDRQLSASAPAVAPPVTPATVEAPPGRLATSAEAAVARAPVPPREPSRRTTADRLLLSGEDEVAKASPGDEHPLRLSTRLSTELLGKSSESQRAMLRIEYQLLSALHTQAAQQLAIALQIRQLEGTLDALRRKSVEQPLPLQDAAAVAPAGTADSDRPSRPTVAPAAAKTPASPAAAASETDWWFEASLLLGLIAALAWFLRRRSVTPSSAAALAAPEVSPDASADDSRWELQLADDGRRSKHDAATASTADSLLAPDDGGNDPAALPVREADDEVTAVLELAEIMLSFGRTKGARHALEEFIGQQPTAAVTPWLKLLEVHRQGNEQAAFESLAMKLTSLFNVAAPAWEAAEELNAPILAGSDLARMPVEQILARLPTIGGMTHIRRELLRLWDSSDCLAYLDRLLRDNRKGERRGFELAAVRELLVLTDIQQNRRLPAS